MSKDDIMKKYEPFKSTYMWKLKGPDFEYKKIPCIPLEVLLVENVG
jgi:hypothetical protein